MSYHLEQEIKSILSFEDFSKLLSHFHLQETDGHWQSNSYYDTPHLKLKSLGAALRLRTLKLSSEWTYKQKQTHFQSLELTKKLNEPLIPAPLSITLKAIADPVISDQLIPHLQLDEKLNQLIHFKTQRWTVYTQFGEIALDYTQFNHGHDYEIELETDNLEEGQAFLKELFAQYQIPFLPADKKIARALMYQ